MNDYHARVLRETKKDNGEKEQRAEWLLYEAGC